MSIVETLIFLSSFSNSSDAILISLTFTPSSFKLLLFATSAMSTAFEMNFPLERIITSGLLFLVNCRITLLT